MASQSKYVQNDLDANWTNSTNAQGAPDGSCAESATNNQEERYDFTGDLFTIPAGATINGFEVTIERACDTNDFYDIDLLDSTSTWRLKIGTAGPTGGCGSDTAETLGANNDLWGGTWTVAWVNSTSFQVLVRQSKAAAQDTTYVDSIQVTIHYSETASYTQDFDFDTVLLKRGTQPVTNDAVLVERNEATVDFDAVLVKSGSQSFDFDAVLKDVLPFEDGFEEGDFAWWSGTVGSPTVVTDQKKSGTYSCKIDAALEYVFLASLDESHIFVQAYVRFSSLPTGGERISLFSTFDTGGVNDLVVLALIDVSGTLNWRISRHHSGGYTPYDVEATVSVDTWYRIELEVVIADSGEMRAWQNGELIHDQTGDTNDFGNVKRVRVGQAFGAGAYTFWFDDVKIEADTIGPYATTFDYDAYVLERNEATVDFDAVLIESGIQGLDSDAILTKRGSATVDFDAVLEEGVDTYTIDFDFDAYLHATQSQGLSFDAYLLERNSQPFDFDAVPLKRGTQPFDYDAVLHTRETQGLTSDAILLKRGTQPFDSDGYLTLHGTQPFDYDARLLERNSQTVDFDAVLESAGAVQYTIDFDYDALLEARQSKGLTYDAVLKLRGTQPLTSDAVLTAVDSLSFDFDAMLLSREASTFNYDAILESETVVTPSVGTGVGEARRRRRRRDTPQLQLVPYVKLLTAEYEVLHPYMFEVFGLAETSHKRYLQTLRATLDVQHPFIKEIVSEIGVNKRSKLQDLLAYLLSFEVEDEE